MKQRCPAWLYKWIFTAVLLQVSLTSVTNAFSEMYVGGQIGTSIASNSLKDVELTDFSPSGTMSDRDLSRSILLGGKIGYYFPQAKWLGVETEVFYTTPHIKQQNTAITVPPGAVVQGFGPVCGIIVCGVPVEGVLGGDYLRVITWAPVNLMFRYHKTKLQPYVGFGPGIFFAQVNSTAAGFEAERSSTKVGLNAKLGAQYFFTRYIAGFAEVKYNYTTFNFDSENGNLGFKATYNPVIVSFGVSFHF